MADGFRRLRINTQERAMSPDINRLQSFMHQETAELFRYMLNMSSTTEDDQLGVVSEPSTIETPLRAEIINGGMVKPQIGSMNLLVDPMILFAMAPDAAPDESNYKYLRDPGVAIAGALTMTANASGSTRVDVIECAIDPVDAVVTDSRDIFNPSTGLFAAATVTKELRGVLQYRVRLGTPGAGMPALAAGWLPLAVASVPTGTTTTDTITFWDVRPLISDRQHQPFASGTDLARPVETHAFLDYVAGPVSTLIGHTAAFSGGRKVGGRLRRGTPGTDADSIILTDAANIDPNYVLAAQQFVHLYLLTPFGLPRWARYTDFGSGARKPRSPRGIPVLSLVAPLQTGAPSSAVSLPTSCGFVSQNTTSGVCIGSALMKSGGGVDSTAFNGRNVMHNFPVAANSITGVVASGNTYKWTLTPGVHYPGNARGLFIALQHTKNVTLNNYVEDDILFLIYKGAWGASAAHVSVQGDRSIFPNPTGGTIGVTRRIPAVWIPIPTFYPGALPASFDVAALFNGAPTIGPFLIINGHTL